MKCPVDNETLTMTERNGVEIDYCPQCRGVWLDRGELDKIIERSSAGPSSRTHRAPDRSRPDHSRQDHSYKKRKKESFLGELFDF